MSGAESDPPPEPVAAPADVVARLREAVAALASAGAQLAVGPAELLSAKRAAAALLGVGRDKFAALTKLKGFPGAVGFGHDPEEVLMYRRTDLLRYVAKLKVMRS